MSLNAINTVNSFNFKGETEVVSKPDEIVKNDLVKSPETDTLEKEATENTAESPKKKKHIVRKILLGTISALVLLYGCGVLKHKLSKPSLEEVQKTFKEIFERDLSNEEINDLISKYKELIKNDNTEDYAKQMIEQLKKDYGIGCVETNVDVKLLKDNKLSTYIDHVELGVASPFGKIDIMPRTNSNTAIKSIQKEIFSTGFHELKHMKQFADAYRTDPDKFVDAMYKLHIDKATFEEAVQEMKKELEITCNDFIKETIAEAEKTEKEELVQLAKESKTSDKELKEALNEFQQNFDEMRDYMEERFRETFYEEVGDIEKRVETEIKNQFRKILDERFGKLEPYKEGTPEYQKGLEYIEAYAKYPDPNTNYDAYRDNLLEKEAWKNGELAEKIYKYCSSIWKL